MKLLLNFKFVSNFLNQFIMIIEFLYSFIKYHYVKKLLNIDRMADLSWFQVIK